MRARDYRRDGRRVIDGKQATCTMSRRRIAVVRAPLIIALLVAVLALTATPARAAFGISSFTVNPSTTAAAAHPDVQITTNFSGGDDVKDLQVHLPAGLVGNPKATGLQQCDDAHFNASSCPADSQVGSATVVAASMLGSVNATGGVFNLVPHTGEPARLGSIVHADPPFGLLTNDVRVQFPVTLRPDDFGLDTTITDLPDQVELIAGGSQAITITQLQFTLNGMVGGQPFMTNPTSCGPATTKIDADSYQAPTTKVSASSTFTPTACGSVPFAPTMGISLETTRADTPSGYTVTLDVPATETPLRQAHVRRTEVLLPEGTTLNPGNADGLEACSDAQFGVGSNTPAACPAASQIGTVSFNTPVIDHTLGGQVFFGAPSASSPLRLFVAVDDPATGLRIKLPGDVTPDPATGQLKTVFDNLPQVPFTSFKLSFNGGPKAVLANPVSCGTFTASTRLTPWSGGADATPTATFTISDDGAGAPCPASRPFSPSLSAAARNTQAGGSTGALTLTVERPDRDQRLRSLNVSLPPGLAGQIAGLPTCPDDRAASGDCPGDSRVGTVTNTVGSGDAPITLTGPVYLGGPYKGGLASIIAVVPAKVGPLDLGNVVLRNALSLRSADSGVDVRSDDLPSFLGGIPVSVRKLMITLDKPGMLSNPTSCAPQSIVGHFTSADGATADARAPFQATGCDALAFAPKLSASLGEPGQVGPNAKPPITTTISQAPGEANLRRATVTLPLSVGPDLAVLNQACPAAVAAVDQCPATSMLGTAQAVTPLLPVTLSGPVFLVERAGEQLPGLEVHLGPIVSLKLAGTFGFSPDRRITSTFDAIPDVPISRFTLSLTRGLTGSGKGLCFGDPPTVEGAFVDQNGRPASDTAIAALPGCQASADVTLSGVKSGKPKLTLLVRQVAGAPGLARVGLALPRGLTGNRRAARRGAKGTAARKLSRKAVKVGKRSVAAKLPSGTRTLKLTLGKGALRAARTLRRKPHRKLTFKVTVADASGNRQALRVKARG
jgi:hypothetical protein